MNYKAFLFYLLFMRAFSSFAVTNDTIKVFYPINKYELAASDKLKINIWVDSLKAGDTLKVFGYADYLGNKKDNLVLSVNRAESIKNYILSRNSRLLVLTDGKGEVEATTGKSADGEPINRRVDIVRPNKILLKKPAARPLVDKPVAVKRKPEELKTDSVRRKMPEITVSDATPNDKRSFNEKINSLEKLEIGSSISLEELTFQPGRHFLNPEAVRYVNTLLKYLKKHGNITFEIQGHICCDYAHFDGLDFDTGDQTLSNNRAKFIYDYFLKNGITADRMTYKGLGNSKPKAYPERSEHDKYVNRRVEILITGK